MPTFICDFYNVSSLNLSRITVAVRQAVIQIKAAPRQAFSISSTVSPRPLQHGLHQASNHRRPYADAAV
jgi:hypothetical protein